MKIVLAIVCCAVLIGCSKKPDEPTTQKPDMTQAQPDSAVKDSVVAGTPTSPSETSKPIAPEMRKPRTTEHPLKNKRWKLVQIAGTTIEVTEKFDSDPYLTFSTMTDKVRGSGGCNRFGAVYELSDNSISISGLARTKKYCEGAMNVEDPFMRELATVDGYEVVGDAMWLKRGGKKVMKFEALYLN